jgi:uncharacterized protein YqeY
MPLVDQIQKDIVTAMKAKDEARLSTLRMVKSALQLKTVEKMSPLDDKESHAVLNTLIKQRKESVEQFTKGGRQEMADKEAAEIIVIESYLPKAASEADIAAGVKETIAEMGSPTMKDMGTVMKNAMAKFNAAGMRVDGKVVSEVRSGSSRGSRPVRQDFSMRSREFWWKAPFCRFSLFATAPRRTTRAGRAGFAVRKEVTTVRGEIADGAHHMLLIVPTAGPCWLVYAG